MKAKGGNVMAENEVEKRRARMADDLNKAIGVHGSAAKRNYFFTFSLALLATIASILAGILAFLQFTGVWVGVLALIPAASAILLSRLKLQERANWYYRKKDGLLGLYNELHYELPDPPTSVALAELSKKWTALNLERATPWGTSLAFVADELQATAERKPSP